MGPDGSEAKRRRHRWKCQQTSSASLGIRICGMQVFQISDSAYAYLHKYEGRDVTSDGVGDLIRKFFHNGKRWRRGSLLAIQTKLKQLISMIQKENHFLIYSASLLVIYEGAEDEEDDRETKSDHEKSDDNPHVDLCLVDFSQAYEKKDLAHSLSENTITCDAVDECDSLDDGFLDGLLSLENILSSLSLDGEGEKDVWSESDRVHKNIERPKMWDL